MGNDDVVLDFAARVELINFFRLLDEWDLEHKQKLAAANSMPPSPETAAAGSTMTDNTTQTP